MRGNAANVVEASFATNARGRTCGVVTQERSQTQHVVEVDGLSRSVRPSCGDAEVRPLRGKSRLGKIASWDDARRVVRVERNFVRVSDLFEIGCETGESAASLIETDKNAAAGFAARRAMHAFHSRDGAARQQTANIDHFIGWRGA